ncbi:MAG TPA: nucleoside monophosphate kinase [archaeon]|nr:nucleoside monophosphate kinase [archaeon]
MTKKIIIMVGPAGSGKGTQNKLIERDFGYKPFSMGEILREEVNKKTILGKKINEIISKGNMVSLEIASDLIFNKIKKEKSNKILMDGFPREYDQAAVFDYFLHSNDYELVGVIHLNISKKESVKRLLLRKRNDDTEKAIKKRLEDYDKITKKVIQRYKEKGKLIEIDGNQSIENVYKEIKRKLKEHKI